MKIKECRKRGWTIERGAYYGTTDNRADRWYAYKWDTYHAIDRRGPGFPTRKAAIAAVEEWEASQGE